MTATIVKPDTRTSPVRPRVPLSRVTKVELRKMVDT